MKATCHLDYNEIPTGQRHTLFLMLQLDAGPAPEVGTRRPLNLSLVIDRSGSMAGQKIEYTRQAAKVLVQNLGAADTLSIVLYNDTVETLLMPEKVTNKDLINQQISKIKPGGTTNLSGGWLEGCQLVARNMSGDQLNRVILMSDGLANRGVVRPDQLIPMTQIKQNDGVTTTTMGLGKDFNEDLLMQMANAGGGAFYFIESPEVAPDIFREELNGLLNVVGQNLVVGLALTEYVTGVVQMNDYPFRTDGKNAAYRMGDVFGEETKTLMLEINVPPLTTPGPYRLGMLRIEYDDLHADGATRRSVELPIDITVSADAANRLPDPSVRHSVLILQAAQARREAVKAADGGRFDTASQILRTAADAIERSQFNNPELQDEQKALQKQATDIERGAAAYDQYERKSMATQAFYTMHGRHEDTQMLRVREEKRADDQTSQSEPIVPPPPEIKVERADGVSPTYVTWNGQIYPLNGDIIRIGRAKHNEIIITATGVSRFHCQIKRQDGDLIIEDLGSKNGTMIDGQTLNGPHVLNVGDVVHVCDEKLVFHSGNHSEGFTHG